MRKWKMHALKKNMNVMHEEIMKTITMSFIRPTLEYVAVVWNPQFHFLFYLQTTHRCPTHPVMLTSRFQIHNCLHRRPEGPVPGDRTGEGDG